MARERKSDTGAGARLSRRSVMQTAASALASGATATLSAAPAAAQSARGDADPQLSRLQSARRILLKGGIVLSGDPRVGDFAAADILIARVRQLTREARDAVLQRSGFKIDLVG